MNVKVGLIGIRGYGRYFFSLIKESLHCNLIACYHKDPKVVFEEAIKMKCTPYSNEETFWGESGIHAVILCIPNEYHYYYAKKALEKNIHVLIEKPLTNTVKEGSDLIELANKRHLVLMVGHNHRKNGFIMKIKEELEAKRIGDIVAAEFNMSHGGGLKFGPEKWRFHKDKCPGGPLNMLGTHLIDTSNFLFGNVRQIRGISKNLYANTTTDDMSLIQLEYESGVVANITTLYNSVSTEFINIYGTEGALRFSMWPNECLWFQPKDTNCECATYEKLEYKKLNSQRILFEEFIRHITNNTPQNTNARESLDVVKIMENVLVDNG